MSYQLSRIRGRVGVASDTLPLSFEMGLTESDAGLLFCVVEISAVSAGVGALTPGVISFEHSWDDGASWVTVPGTAADSITAAGTFTITTTTASGQISPLARLTVTAPAGQTVTISKVRKIEFAPGHVPTFRPFGTAPTAVTMNGENFISLADRQVAVSPAGGTLIADWPYVAYDKVEATWTVGTFTEVFEYFSGVTSVGTVTVVYTDATREFLASVTYSPARRN